MKDFWGPLFVTVLGVVMLVLVLTHPAFVHAQAKVDDSPAAIEARRQARREGAKHLPAIGGPCEAMPKYKNPPPPPPVFVGPTLLATIEDTGGRPVRVYKIVDGSNTIYVVTMVGEPPAITVVKN